MTNPEDTVATTETPETAASTENAPAPNHPGARETRYRVERNEAREQVTALTARLAALQRAEVERLAGARLSHPEDLFTLSGNDVADYLDDNGNVDPDKVAADVAAILSERPGLGPTPAVDRSQGFGNTASEATWASVFNDA